MEYSHFITLLSNHGLAVTKTHNTSTNAGISCNRVLFDALPLVWKWNDMDHPDLLDIKANGTRILVFVPYKIIPRPADKTQTLPPRLCMARWAQAAALGTKSVTPSKFSVDLVAQHGGFWASDGRGIKPLKGLPSLWTYLPHIDCMATKTGEPK